MKFGILKVSRGESVKNKKLVRFSFFLLSKELRKRDKPKKKGKISSTAHKNCKEKGGGGAMKDQEARRERRRKVFGVKVKPSLTGCSPTGYGNWIESTTSLRKSG